MRLLTPLLALLFTLPLPAQTYVKVANEGDTITATATVRYGVNQGAPVSPGFASCATVGGCWINLSVSGTFVISNYFFKADPAPGSPKELDVLLTSVAQTVVVNRRTITVPAAPPPSPPPTPTTYIITCTTPPLTDPLPATTPASCTVTKQ